ncbi:hypothetical protein [Candidatus Methylomirabilis sp.]|uniref:hypothetical protein n=1 Tax=Candidatus Methylomirabilis sp. TaxID=2032687 RepID=UPI002A634C94|nr:hypothetical protein [Candidatus Methylomirabilis sp.]
MNDVLTTMNAFGRGFWGRLSRGFAHAFALRWHESRLKAEDLALLDRFAGLLADRGLTTPAIFLVESLAPLGFLASQLVHAMTPIMGMVAPPDDIERLAHLLERGETPALFIERLRRAEDGTEREARNSPIPSLQNGCMGGFEARGAEEGGDHRES